MTRNLPKTSEKKRTGVNLVDHLSGLSDDFDGDDPCVPQDEYDYAQTPVPARASCAQTHEQPVNTADLPLAMQQHNINHGGHHGSSWREHVAMQQAIRNNTTAEVTLHDGLISVAMGEAAHRSIAAHRPIAMSEILA